MNQLLCCLYLSMDWQSNTQFLCIWMSYFNLLKLMLLSSFSGINIFCNNFFITCYCHTYLSYNASSKHIFEYNLWPALTTHVINITIFFKLISSGNLLSISVKVLKSTPIFQKNCFIQFNESSLRMMKIIFYFSWKALFVIKIFKFLSWYFSHLEKVAWFER